MFFSLLIITMSLIAIIFWILPDAWDRPATSIGGKSDVVIILVAVPVLLLLLFI